LDHPVRHVIALFLTVNQSLMPLEIKSISVVLIPHVRDHHAIYVIQMIHVK